MTDPAMRDPDQNFAYYRDNTGYARSDARFAEPRVRWLAGQLAHADTVLDLGANDGFVAQLCPLAEYAGIELNPVAIANAYPRAKGNIVQDNIVSFDYEKFLHWAGVVVCTEVLEHLPDPEGLLRRVRVALKLGCGRLVTTSPVGRGERFEPGNRDHLREWTAPEYRALHERAGYEVVYQGMERVYAGRYTHTLVAKVG